MRDALFLEAEKRGRSREGSEKKPIVITIRETDVYPINIRDKYISQFGDLQLIFGISAH
jgi:hypothetical protein